MPRLGVLISGSGTNLQSIIDACQNGDLDAQVGLVISSKEDAYGLERAKKAGVKGVHINDEGEILKALKEEEIDLVVLAGYLSLVPQSIIDAYPDRITNIHPSLIPSFSGKGYYGLRVHEAAIKRGVKVSGATVHLVNENYDEGRILAQRPVEVKDGDSPEDLQKRVLKVEHEIYIEALKDLIEKEDL